MASFGVKLKALTIEPHPNADALELAKIGEFRAIVRKGQFKTGDLAAYVPEQAILPAELIEAIGLTGRLAGAEKNRVKAIKLRGVLSQGLCISLDQIPGLEGPQLDMDVTALLNISKWEPPVPAGMAGQVWHAGARRCIKYDIENIKAWPGAVEDGEPVVFTEKIHGTWCQIGVVARSLADDEEGRVVISSKGIAARGLALKSTTDENSHNLYVRTAMQSGLLPKLEKLSDELGQSVFVLGEVFGGGIQDLGYGTKKGTPAFRAFDVFIGAPEGDGRYLSHAELGAICTLLEVERVPVLYEGPYSREVLAIHTNGKETVSGMSAHIREGVIVRPIVERSMEELGRVQLKSVSEAYLLRADGTEFA